MPYAPKAPYAEPVELQICFYMPVPKSWSKETLKKFEDGRLYPDKRPDEDNLSYLVTNALKGIVYDDDKRICNKRTFKRYSNRPRTEIVVLSLIEHSLETRIYL